MTFYMPTESNPMVENMENVKRQIDRDGVKFIRFEGCDLHGISRSKTVPAKHFEKYAIKGQHIGLFPMTPKCHLVPVQYFVENGFPNSFLVPDLSTYSTVPWAPKTARFICNISGIFEDASPRNLALKQLEKLNAMGYKLLSGCELEFYMVDSMTKKCVFEGSNPYSTIKGNFDKKLVYGIIENMEKMGVDISASHAEYGPGQMEIIWDPSFGIKSADDAFTFKNGIKEMCEEEGKIVSFMTVPFRGLSGCGFHFGQSLWSSDSEQCLMYDEKSSNLSEVRSVFQILGPGAPTVANWGIENRTCQIRAIINGQNGTYLENRLAGGSANPYLVLSGMVAAGIDGLNTKSKPPEPRQGAINCSILKPNPSVTVIPNTLEKALEALHNDKVIIDALGEKFIGTFTAVKQEEIKLGKEAVGENLFTSSTTDWERDMYFETC